MTEFRPCPSFPNYFAAQNGRVMVGSVPHKAGHKLGPRLIKHVGRDKAYVTLGGKFVRWTALVADAWPDEERPTSSYSDGRIITVHEWRRIMRSGAI